MVSQGVVEQRQLRLQHQRQQQDQQLRQHPLGAVTCNYEVFLILKILYVTLRRQVVLHTYKVELSSPVR